MICNRISASDLGRTNTLDWNKRTNIVYKDVFSKRVNYKFYGHCI